MLQQHVLFMVQVCEVIISDCAATVFHPLHSLRRDNFSVFWQKEYTATALRSLQISYLHVIVSHCEGLTPCDTSMLRTNCVPYWKRKSIQCNGLRLQIPIPEFLSYRLISFSDPRNLKEKKNFPHFTEKKETVPWKVCICLTVYFEVVRMVLKNTRSI